MNLGITGATGLIGSFLVDLALRRGHEVVAFSRTPARALPGCTMRLMDLSTDAAPPNFSGCDAVIHLAGESVMGLWTEGKKRRIRDSRIQGTRRVVEGIAALPRHPEVLVSGSAIGFYGDSGDQELSENSPSGEGFLSETCRDWEAEAMQAKAERIVLLRTGIVLSPRGGAMGAMGPVFRAGLGGVLGSGRQWMSWIHLEDLARMILFAVEDASISGPLNGTAPWPVRNADFSEQLARQLRRPCLFRVPAFALRWLGEFSHELLDSKRVLPALATSHGFPFRYPELATALTNLL